MKTEITTTVKLTIKGQEIELTEEEARDLAKSLNAALKLRLDPDPVAEKVLQAIRDAERRGTPQRLGPNPFDRPMWPAPHTPVVPYKMPDITCSLKAGQ